MKLTVIQGVIPATLGNIIGGSLFCGCFYWWMYIFGKPPIEVDGTIYSKPAQEDSGAEHTKTGRRVRVVDEESR